MAEQLGVTIGRADVKLGSGLARELAAQRQPGGFADRACGQGRERGEPPEATALERSAGARGVVIE